MRDCGIHVVAVVPRGADLLGGEEVSEIPYLLLDGRRPEQQAVGGQASPVGQCVGYCHMVSEVLIVEDKVFGHDLGQGVSQLISGYLGSSTVGNMAA